MTQQLTMHGNPTYAVVLLDQLPEVEAPAKGNIAYKQLVQSINTLGLLIPVTLHKQKKNSTTYRIVAGRRRIAAARELGWTSIPAMIYDGRVDQAFIPSATVAENAVRSPNLRADIDAVNELMAQGRSVDEISDLTGLTKQEVERTQDVLALPREIVDGVRAGAISKSTADLLRKSTPETVASTLNVLRNEGKLTAKSVRDVRSVGFQASTAALDLPETPAMSMPLRETMILKVLDDDGMTPASKLKEIRLIITSKPQSGALL